MNRPRSAASHKQLSSLAVAWILIFLILPFGMAMADTPVDVLLDRSLEDLMAIPVNSVGFYEMPLDQIPGSVWILDEERLKTIPGISLKDILQLAVPGVQVSSDEFLGSLYTSRGCPMLDNATTQFMWDGMSLNAAGSLGINASLKSSLLGDVAKIEVGNGPSSMLHGNGAINGFVNQVPKSGSSHPGSYVNATLGYPESLVKTETGFGHVYGPGKDVYIYAGAEEASGFSPHRDLGYSRFNSGQIPEHFPVRSKDTPNYRLSLNWNHNAVGLVGFIQRERLSLDTYAPFMAEAPELYYQTLALRPAATLPLTARETLSVNLPLTFFDNGYISERKRLGSRVTAVEHGNSDLRVETNWVLRSLRWDRQQWAAGVRASQERHRNNRYLFRSDPPKTQVGGDIDWKEYSLFTEDIIRITPWWTLTAGIRLDAIRYDFGKGQATLSKVVQDSQRWFPRLASALCLGENTTLKLSFQKGFHYPSATALYASNLEPEYLDTYELNLLHSLPQLGLTLTANSFFNIYKNGLVAGSKIPSDPTRRDFGSLGGEIAVDWQGPDSLRATISYAYSRPHSFPDENASVSTANEDLSKWLYYPAHSVKALVSCRWFGNALMTSLAAEYGSGVDRNEFSWYEGRELFRTNRYALSFKAEYAVTDQVALSLIINNLMDNNIPVPSREYLRPWEGGLGDTETRFYLGLTWQAF